MIKVNKIDIYLIYFIKIILLCIIVISNNRSEASSLNQQKYNAVYDITLCKPKKHIAICINLDKKYSIELNLLNEPYRIVLNFDNIIKISKNSINKINDKAYLINQIRFGYPNKLVSRLVLELNQPAIVSEFIYKKDINNNNKITKLHIELAKTTRTEFVIAKHVLSENNGNILGLNDNYTYKFDLKNQTSLFKNKVNDLPKLRPKKISSIKNSISKNNKIIKNKYIVFIDPGHGGRDPGAIGKLGTFEKNITLRASLELAKYLERTNKITAVLSRTTDTYLPLRRRIKLAKANQADIFISLHADASQNRNAQGLSVFSLSDKASDKEAKMIAERENAVDIIPGIKNDINDPIVYGNLIKMFQRQAMNDSAFLAKNIIINLKKTKITINRGHRFAGFAVLKAHDIPSVLIELGFISNLKEEKKMLNKQYLKNLTKNLTMAIENYFLKVKN